MAESLQATLENLQFSDYISVVALTAITYDYLLMFGCEVEHIWRRPWSLMSFLYVIVRYLGIVIAMGQFYIHVGSSAITFKFMNWAYYFYMLALEATMILRIFAMYNQSKRLLYILLALFLPVVIVELVGCILYYGPSNGRYATDTPIAGMQICTSSFSLSPLLYTYIMIPRIVFDGILTALAIAQLVRHATATKRAFGECNVHMYIRILARDNVLYFIGELTYRSFNFIPLANVPATYQTLAEGFAAIEPFVLPPRLVISFRKYHAKIVANSDAGISMESIVFREGDLGGNND